MAVYTAGAKSAAFRDMDDLIGTRNTICAGSRPMADDREKIERVAKAIKEAWATMGHMHSRFIRMKL
jgi:hypothetical protein